MVTSPTPENGDEPESAERPAPNALPFVVALVGVTVVAVLAFVFLRTDDDGELVRPDRLSVVDEDTIEVIAYDRRECDRVLTRAQVDMADDDAVYVELVVEPAAETDCTDIAGDLEAVIDLPSDLEGRELRPGVGRFQIPCDPSGTCSGEQ